MYLLIKKSVFQTAYLIAFCFIISVFSCNIAFGDLPIKSPSISLNGKIVDWIYRGPTKYLRDTQSSGGETNIPGHYILLIEDKMVDRKSIKANNFDAKRIYFLDPFLLSEKKSSDAIVFLFMKKNEKIKIGSKISLSDYQLAISGVDFSPEFKKLKINEEELSLDAIGEVPTESKR